MWKIREDGRSTHPRKNTHHHKKEQPTKMKTVMLRAAGTATVAGNGWHNSM
jgi:ribosomal protein L4